MLRATTTILIILLSIAHISVAQNSTCANASPFCTGQTMQFPAGVNAGTAQQGPNYGCLLSQPNPAWFFMQISTGGPVSISMSAANDIDFICWGPFPNLSSACNNLTNGNTQSCSYSPSNTETCTIANAVAGQFYLMLITNFSNKNQSITFNQNNANNPGAGTTNCGFVCAITGTTTGAICAGQSAFISVGLGTSTSVVSYTWTGPGGFTSNSSYALVPLQSTTVFTLTGTNTATINGSAYSGTCQALVTASVIQYPSFNVTPSNTTICQGGSFFAGVTFTPVVNPANFTYTWTPYPNSGILQPNSNPTYVAPPLLPTTVSVSTMVYSVTVAPTNTGVVCAVTKTMQVTVNNPPTPIIATTTPVCDVFNPIQLTATPGGGTWSANPAVNASGSFSPGIASIGIDTVKYTIMSGVCKVSNTQTISVSKFYSPALTSNPNLCVLDPVFNLMNIAQNTISGTWSGPQVSGGALFNPAGLATGNYSLTYNTTSLPDPTVCPASTVLVVPVFNPPTPVIDPILPRCTNATSLVLTATPANGVWSGVFGISVNGVQTPSANPIGTNSVTYTAGQGTCVASSSRTFHVSQFNTAALSGNFPELCATIKTISLLSITQNTTGVWSGIGTNNDNVFYPGNLKTGAYTLTYNTVSVPNATLCPDSRTISISVLNPPVPQIKTVGPFCTNQAPLQLTVTPAIGRWLATSYLSPTGIFTPGLSHAGGNLVEYVIGTNTCNTKQAAYINTESFISAAVSGGLPDQCVTNQQIDLQPLALNNTGYWTGSGISGTSFNPAKSGTGKITLTYNTASIPSGLCPDKATISVNVFSLATPVIAEIGPFCNRAMPVQLDVSPVGGVFGSNVTGVVSKGGLFNPAMGIVGDNIVSYSIASGPCIADAQAHILVEKFVSADFESYAGIAYCINEYPFDLQSLVQNPGGTFSSEGESVMAGSSMFNPAKANIGYNTIIYQTHSYPTFSLCPDTKTISIKVKDIPTIIASSSSYSGCVPFEALFTSSTSVNGFGAWNLDDGSPAQKGTTANHIYTSPGSYSVVFTFEDGEAKGCNAQSVVKTINVYEKPKADFSVLQEEITISNPEATFINLSTVLGNNRYRWTIEGLNQVSDVNPVVYFPQIGNYRVTLLATTINGCTDEISKVIQVKNEFSVFIPNSFTPNYDGLNDTFKPVFSPFGLDTKNYKLEIFDRWGHELFSTDDYQKGWDGTVKGGDASIKQEVYVYKLFYKDLDGQAHNEIGTVTLIK